MLHASGYEAERVSYCRVYALTYFLDHSQQPAQAKPGAVTPFTVTGPMKVTG